MNIRCFHSSDVTAIGKLYDARGLAFDLELFEWKKRAPVCCSWVGEIEGQVIAHYSIMELPLKPGLRTGFAVDAILDPGHGRMEEVAQLIQHGLKEAALMGLDAVVGFPNERMAKIKRFLGWEPVGIYNWKESRGITRPSSKPATLNYEEATVYGRWRWESSPRAYYKVFDDNGQPIAWFGYLDNGMLVVLRHHPSYWEVLTDSYRFVYLEQAESSNVHIPETVVPLYYSLRDDITDWKWPLYWPLETVEGVTLGW